MLCQGATVKFQIDPLPYGGRSGFPNRVIAWVSKNLTRIEVDGDISVSDFAVSFDQPRVSGTTIKREPARFRLKGLEPGIQGIVFGVIDSSDTWNGKFVSETFLLTVTVLDPATKNENKDVVDAVNGGGEELDNLIPSSSPQQIEAAATKVKGLLQPLNIPQLTEKLAASLSELDELIANPPDRIEDGDLQATRTALGSLSDNLGTRIEPELREICYLPGQFQNQRRSFLWGAHADDTGCTEYEYQTGTLQVGDSNSGEFGIGVAKRLGSKGLVRADPVFREVEDFFVSITGQGQSISSSLLLEGAPDFNPRDISLFGSVTDSSGAGAFSGYTVRPVWEVDEPLGPPAGRKIWLIPCAQDGQGFRVNESITNMWLQNTTAASGTGVPVSVRVTAFDASGVNRGSLTRSVQPDQVEFLDAESLTGPLTSPFSGSVAVEVLGDHPRSAVLPVPRLVTLTDLTTFDGIRIPLPLVAVTSTGTSPLRSDDCAATVVVPLMPVGLANARVWITNYTQLTEANQTAHFHARVFGEAGNLISQQLNLSLRPGEVREIDVSGREGFMVLEGLENFTTATVVATYGAGDQAGGRHRFFVLGQWVAGAGFPMNLRQPVGIDSSAVERLQTRFMLINTSALAGESETLNLDLSLTDRELVPLNGVVPRTVEAGRALVFDVDDELSPPQQNEGLFNALLHIEGTDGNIRENSMLVFAVATSPVGKNYLTPPPSVTRASAEPASQYDLYFAQFGKGGGLFSQIILFNPDGEKPARGRITLKKDNGELLTVGLNGQAVAGVKDITVPPFGLGVYHTDTSGPAVSGSVHVLSDRLLAGVVNFGGVVGLAGVGDSLPTTNGFRAPIETDTAAAINTGIAITNLGNETVTVDLKLCDSDGEVLASAQIELPMMGHSARFVNEIQWDQTIDFSNFFGLLKVAAEGTLAATAIQSRPGEFVTLPVAPTFLGDLSVASSSQVAATPQTPIAELDEKLYFAHFGDGQGLSSQIVLMNLDENLDATTKILLKDDSGQPLSVDLNGSDVAGETNLTIPAGGVRVLRTDGLGDLTVGSVTVCSDTQLAGVILFAGSFGVAGVGSSEVQSLGFVAPVESNTADLINTGIAFMNLESEEVTADLQLCDPDGNVLATAQITLPAMAHRARFLNELNWDPEVNLTAFQGLLKASVPGNNRIAATVIQTRPNQFSTNPVASILPPFFP